MPANTSDTPAGIGLSEAASRIEALSDTPDTQETSTNATTQASENAETEQVEATAADTSEEETPLSDNADNEDVEANDADTEVDPADDEEGAEEDEAPTDDDDKADTEKLMSRNFTVKISGKEEQVTLKEALAGYQRTADYTRSKMALADEKRAFEGDREAVLVERSQYAQLLPVLIQQLEVGMEQEPDWADLLANKPEEYIRQEVLWRDKQARRAAALEEQNRLNEQKAIENHQELLKAVKQSGDKLAEAMPAWKDPQRWDKDREKLMAYGVKLGFAEEEMKQTYDHRAVLALYKAMRYDELMAKRPTPDKPTGPKSLASGSTASRQTRKPTEISRAKQRLAKTGSVRDAANLFEQLDP